MIAKDYVPPWVRGDFDYYQLTVCRSTTSVGAQQGTVSRQSLAIAGAFGDDLVAGVGQASRALLPRMGSSRLTRVITAMRGSGSSR